MSWSADPDLFELSTVAPLAVLTAYQWLQFVWVRFKNSILLVENLSLQTLSDPIHATGMHVS